MFPFYRGSDGSLSFRSTETDCQAVRAAFLPVSGFHTTRAFGFAVTVAVAASSTSSTDALRRLPQLGHDAGDHGGVHRGRGVHEVIPPRRLAAAVDGKTVQVGALPDVLLQDAVPGQLGWQHSEDRFEDGPGAGDVVVEPMEPLGGGREAVKGVEVGVVRWALEDLKGGLGRGVLILGP